MDFPGWISLSARRRRGYGRRPLTLQVLLSTADETCCSVTVMNDFTYPLIIAHSGAGRGPLIKMSWGTAGLLHLYCRPQHASKTPGSPEAFGLKKSGWSRHCHSAVAVSVFAWWSAISPVEQSRCEQEREGVSIRWLLNGTALVSKLKQTALYRIVTHFFSLCWCVECERGQGNNCKKQASRQKPQGNSLFSVMTN